MSAPFAKSPARPPTPGAAPPFEVLAHAQWQGLELLWCREDIRTPTQWAIHAPRHTVIVHLGGGMRSLETEIEGLGAAHGPPAPGDIWLVPAGAQYHGQAKGTIISYAELRVAPEAGVALPGASGAELGSLGGRLAHRDEFFLALVARLARLAREPDDLSAMMAEGLQDALRQHLFRDYRAALVREAPPRGDALSALQSRRLSDYIEARLDRRIRLDDLAEVAGISVHRLLVAFRMRFGTTPMQYILERRLRQARWQLLNTDRPILEIAMACGFSSHGHFTATFRRATGTTPQRFRGGLRTRAAD